MFQSWDNTRELTRASWGVLKREPALVLFPLLGIISASLLIVPFYSITHLGFEGDSFTSSLVWGMLFYLLGYFAILFFNCCIAACTMMAFNGESPSIAGGISIALTRLPQIFLWALFSATVGLLLHIIERQSNRWGGFSFTSLITSFMGIAWTWGSLLVLPVIIVEGDYPFTAFGTSASLFRQTWGEEFLGELRVNFPILIPLFLCGAAMVGSMSASQGWALPLFVAGGAGIFILLVMRSVVSVIFKVALYYFATQKRFPQALLDQK